MLRNRAWPPEVQGAPAYSSSPCTASESGRNREQTGQALRRGDLPAAKHISLASSVQCNLWRKRLSAGDRFPPCSNLTHRVNPTALALKVSADQHLPQQTSAEHHQPCQEQQ